MTTSSLKKVLDHLERLGQGRFMEELPLWGNRLDGESLTMLGRHILSVDPTRFASQQQALAAISNPAQFEEIHPFTNLIPIQEESEAPLTALQEGRIGAILVAGGQGTRLGFNGPKGLFPLDASGKTLFHLHLERIFVRSLQVRCPLKLAVMTSPLNYAETRAFFEQQHFFGLDPANVTFYSQPLLPLLDKEGHLFCNQPGSLARGPDGNGSALISFLSQGILQDWMEQGIEHVTFTQIDNALADPFDPHLIAAHMETGADVTVNAIERIGEKESLGLLVRRGQTLSVAEYSEVPERISSQRDSAGQLSYCAANISHFCFSLSFVKQLNESLFPLHPAYKRIGRVMTTGTEDPDFKAWKFEAFIFDCLPLAGKTAVLLRDRDNCFAPLKNKEGSDSPETVMRALQRRTASSKGGYR